MKHRIFALDQLAKSDSPDWGMTRHMFMTQGLANPGQPIMELRRRGWDIDTEMHVDRYGRRYAKYILNVRHRPAARDYVDIEAEVAA
jgi:hypothetical protein